MAMEATPVPACKPKMIPKIKAKPNLKPNLKPNTGTVQSAPAKIKPVMRPAPKFKPKPKPNPLVKVAPRPLIVSVGDTDSDSDSDDDDDIVPDASQFYQRWINGEQLLISMDNKRIYDPDTYEHIGTVCDETIDWNVA